MPVGDAVGRADPGLAWAEHLPSDAVRVIWEETPTPYDLAHRYGVAGALLRAGVAADRIQVFRGDDDDVVYWVVTLDGGRVAVLTDDTEAYVCHIEGPWPFLAVFLGPDAGDGDGAGGGVRTELDDSIINLRDRVAAWCAGAPAEGASGTGGDR
ncbi:hypothetical protein [Streptomyces sp. NPDC091371]|uniref:hypothetical protein n=1 Tax=Streptomyces sp. NPDC091371 TaxID=3155303 RepID=UPI003424CA42